MTLPEAWMRQAESDFRAAHRLDSEADPRSRCQAIAKYQQSVEKSVKAVLDRLYAANLARSRSDRKHPVARYVAALTRFPATPDSRDLLRQMQRLFTHRIIEQVKLLDSLVPEYPPAGTLAKRNHEYPFEYAAGDWRAPADADAFTAGEIKRIRHCAGVLIPALRRILDALDLLYP